MSRSYRLKAIIIVILVKVTLAAFVKTSMAQQPAQPHHEQEHSTKSDSESDLTDITDLVRAALDANPEITVMQREYDAARARIPQAKALPDPMVMIGNVNVGSPVPFLRVKDGFNESFNLGFSQDFPWFGIRRLRGQVAGSEAEAKYQEYRVAVRRVTADVKMAAYELYNIDRALAIIKRDIDILGKIAKVSEVRYSVGKAQQVDVINAHLEITDLLDKQGNLEARRIGAVARINNLLFRDPETPINGVASFKMSPEPPSLEDLVRLAGENAPDIQQQKRMIEARNHAVRLAEREAKYPEVGFLFIYHNRTPDDPAFYNYQISLKLPLYAFKKQRYAIEEQSANLAAARSRLASTDSMIRYRLRDARVRATTAARLIRLHEQGLIPQSTLALESSLSAYQVGQVDFLTLLTALKRALDYETHYYEMLTDYQKALAEMEAYVGVELTR